MPKRVLVLACVVTGVVAAAGRREVVAQGSAAAALLGIVSSQEEGNMEGVLVSARQDGANFTVTVVSNALGRYSFPAAHLQPGKYTVTMRAVGYDLSAPATVTLDAGKPGSLDLKLLKTKDLASQMTSLEWAHSIPGTPEEKESLVHQLMSCAYCHTWNRIMKSKHSAA